LWEGGEVSIYDMLFASKPINVLLLFCCVPIYVSLCNLGGDTHFPNLLEVIRKHTLPNILKVRGDTPFGNILKLGDTHFRTYLS
jgi:hypothetical protein